MRSSNPRNAGSWILVGALGACGPKPATTVADESGETGEASTGTATDAEPTVGSTSEPVSSSTPVDPTTGSAMCDGDDDCGPCAECFNGQCEAFDCCDGVTGLRCGAVCRQDSECAADEMCVDGECVIVSPPLPSCPPPPTAIAAWELGGVPSGLILLDVDGDGDLDIVAAEFHEGRLELAFNDGSGGFTPGTLIDLGGAASELDLVAGDLDGDGVSDLVVTRNEPHAVIVLRGMGGSFVPVQELASGFPPFALALGRVDDDPSVDLVGVDFDGEFAVVWRGDGVGGLQPAQPVPEVVTTFNGAVRDVDGDGLVDVIGAPLNDSFLVTVARAAGDGGFALAEPLLTGLPGVTRVLAADLEGNGSIDVVGTRVAEGGGGVTVWTAEAPTSWAAPHFFSTSRPLFGAAAIDFDGDAAVDLVSATLSEAVVVLLGDQQGGFLCEQEYVLPISFVTPLTLAVGDVDGDGRPDIVASGVIDGTVAVVTRI